MGKKKTSWRITVLSSSFLIKINLPLPPLLAPPIRKMPWIKNLIRVLRYTYPAGISHSNDRRNQRYGVAAVVVVMDERGPTRTIRIYSCVRCMLGLLPGVGRGKRGG